MDLTPDELAGIADVLGPVTREELVRGCGELAFKRGEDVDPETFAATVESAVERYHLVAVPDHDAGVEAPLLAVGPAAFPTLPDGATDLPHILDLPDRSLSRESVADAAEERFREAAATAVRAGDDDRIESLLDVSYEFEAWGPVDLSRARRLLDEATHPN